MKFKGLSAVPERHSLSERPEGAFSPGQHTIALRRAAGELGSALGRLLMMQQKHQHAVFRRQDALLHPHFISPLRGSTAGVRACRRRLLVSLGCHAL